MKSVYVLWHAYVIDERFYDNLKLLGIFSSYLEAEKILKASKLQPGFRNYPDSFRITPYTIDEINLTELKDYFM